MERDASQTAWSRAVMAMSGIGLGRVRPDEHAALRLEASGGKLSPDRLAMLAHHRDPWVREAVARRDDCPEPLLSALSRDRRALVRRAAAANLCASDAMLARLARDRDSAVARAVARNPAVPESVLVAMLNDRRAEVAHVAARALEEPGGAAPHP